jgi:hypothetical protein
MPDVTTSLRIPNYASAPSGLSGQLYFNSTDKQFYYHDGTNWVMLGLASSSGNVSNSGVPTVGQIALWTDATHIQGVADTTKQWDGGATGLTAATGRTSLGGTTVGQSLFTLTNPNAVTFPKILVGNTVVAESAATHLTSIGLNNVTNDAQIKASDFPVSVSSGQICVFNGAGGKSIQAGTGTGLVTVASGVYAVVADNRSNWDTAFTNNLRWDGGATSLVAATGRTSLGLVIGTNVQAWDSDLDTISTASPGNSQYYGTNASGTKGFYALTPPKVTAIAASGTFTCTTGVRSIKVECLGGGGGGGGAKASAGTCTTGGGGGGGGYEVALLTSGLKASYTVVIGAGGTAGAATPTDGGTGGSTTFDSPSVCTAGGGVGGLNSATGSTVATFAGIGGLGGTGSLGNYGFSGSYGDHGIVQGGGIGKGGTGGSSQWGGTTVGAVNAAAGGVGRSFGGGGSGAASNSATGFAGGAGAAGGIIVTEYF